MQTATLLKNNLTKKQIIILSSVLGAVVLIAVLAMGYFFLFGSPFDAKANDIKPVNVDIQPKADSASVTWQTGIETVPMIEYGTSADPSSFKPLAGESTASTSHKIDLSSLTPGTMYYFQIKVGDQVFDNDGLYWTFTTPKEGSENSGEPPLEGGEGEATPSGTLTPSVSMQPTPSKTASLSGTLTPRPSTSMGPTPTVDPLATPTANPKAVCSSSNCTTIQKNLGTLCSTQDYLRCKIGLQPTAAPETTAPTTSSATATPASTATDLKNLCRPSYIQANSCTNFTWSAMSDIDKRCEDTFTRYFVQCKSSSFTSSDASTWYCNETVSTNSTTVPCQNAPTPAPGQGVFCRVRAETEAGGAANATAWVYANTSCSAYSSSNIAACKIKYLQANTCKSWIWDLVNSKDPTCKAAFSHYFLQCTSNGNFDNITTTPTPRYWYCNTTVENHYLDFPCYNAAEPADGAPIYCRVRAEDGYGTDNHSTDWVSAEDICPTSTPTPTPSPTATPTSTPTPTLTPTP